MISTFYVLPDGHVFAERHDPQPEPSRPVLTIWPYRYVHPDDAPDVQAALLRGEKPKPPLYDGPRQPPQPHDPAPDYTHPDDAVITVNPLCVPPPGTLLPAPLRIDPARHSDEREIPSDAATSTAG